MSEKTDVIYHIVVESDLRTQIEGLLYRPAALATDGFVHCSREGSVLPVANDYYADAIGRVLLVELDLSRLAAETKFEAAAPIAGGGTNHLESAPDFPHIYGPIELDAILRVGVLDSSKGQYTWPDRFESLDVFLESGG
jgi:uncharacterized protein (DUF952 family)